jgi:hypothetical protein
MSARRIPSSASLVAPVTVQGKTTQLNLPASAVRIRKNGIEFRTNDPLPVFTEVSIALQAPATLKKVQCNGVVVACSGDRHQGYRASVLFLDQSPALQERLAALASI